MTISKPSYASTDGAAHTGGRGGDLNNQIQRSGRASLKAWEPHPKSAAKPDLDSWTGAGALKAARLTRKSILNGGGK